MKKEIYNRDTSKDGYCRRRKDKTHCQCWWDGGKCCNCGAPAMTKKEQRAQGMIT